MNTQAWLAGRLLIAATLLLGAHSALALDTPVTPELIRDQHQQSETWLQVQASGRAASTTPQTLAPAERELADHRWLESFKHPLPDFYEQYQGGKTTGNSN